MVSRTLHGSPGHIEEELEEHERCHHKVLLGVVEGFLVNRAHAAQDEEESTHQTASDKQDRASAEAVDKQPDAKNGAQGDHGLDDVEEEGTVAKALGLVEDDCVLARESLASNLLPEHGEHGHTSADLHGFAW